MSANDTVKRQVQALDDPGPGLGGLPPTATLRTDARVIDLSGQWPLSGRWHAVGRINYSFKDDASNQASSAQGGRMVESIAGLEYNGGCWVVRGVVQRSALTADKASTAFFIQLELTDFSRIGSSPLNLLKRNIQGYSLINQTPADPVFGE